MGKSRICLVIPPSSFLLDERVFMALGILRVAAILEHRYDVRILDLSGVRNYEDVMCDYLRIHHPDVVGFTATTPQLPAVVNLALIVRANDIRIIVGGPHVTLVNAAAKRERQKGIIGRASRSLDNLQLLADVLIAGDGEYAIFEALHCATPCIIDADDPVSPLFLKNGDVDKLPFPARHLVDMESYRYFIDEQRATSIIGQLGCPFECGFCGGRYSPSLRRIRTRSIESIIREIRHLYETSGITGFMFYDDELNVSGKLMVRLMHALGDLQDQLGVRFSLRGFVKAQLFNDEQAEAMVRAGFKWVLIGFESGSPEMLHTMNKKATVEDNTRCMEIARRHGLKVKALMSIGHPGESEETILATRDWLLAVHPDDFDVTVITVYPGTPYYDDAVPHLTDPDIWTYLYNGAALHSRDIDYAVVSDYYKGDPDGGYRAFVHTDFLSEERIVEMRDFVERDVRAKLGIPFNLGVPPASRYEHSMGQGSLPAFVLK